MSTGIYFSSVESIARAKREEQLTYIYDLEAEEQIAKMPMGVWGGISMKRLVRLLEESGDVVQGEKITHIMIDDNGFITYRIDKWIKT